MHIFSAGKTVSVLKKSAGKAANKAIARTATLVSIPKKGRKSYQTGSSKDSDSKS